MSKEVGEGEAPSSRKAGRWQGKQCNSPFSSKLQITRPSDGAPRLTSGLPVPGGGVQKGGAAGAEGCQVLPLPLQTALSLFMCQVRAGHLGHIREQHTASPVTPEPAV